MGSILPSGNCMERFAGLLQLVSLDIESLAVIGFLINVTLVKSEAACERPGRRKQKQPRHPYDFVCVPPNS